MKGFLFHPVVAGTLAITLWVVVIFVAPVLEAWM
jgi:hypothetical protein